MKIRFKIGDVFSVPIDNDRLGYGQVVDVFEKVLIYCVFYSHLLTREPKLTPSDILLAGITARAKIENGDWQVVGNEIRNLNDIKRPSFKVMIDERMHIVSFSGQTKRKIEEEEADILTFRNVVAPIRYEKALCAHFGVGDWLQPYDKLLYENVVRSNEISLK
jgi:co-chaperonin GroES (HSP10)